MKKETLMDGIGRVDEHLLDEAASYRGRKNHWKRWAALAACFVLVVGIGVPFLLTITSMGGAGPTTNEAPGSVGNSDGNPNYGITGDIGSTAPPIYNAYGLPVLPLGVLQEDSPLTAQRKVTFDFSGERPKNDPWQVGVEDRYTLSNPTDEDITVEVYYPMVGTWDQFREDPPALTLNGTALEAALEVFCLVDDAWEDMKQDVEQFFNPNDTLLRGRGELAEIPVAVYTYEYKDLDPKDITAWRFTVRAEVKYGEGPVRSYGFDHDNSVGGVWGDAPDCDFNAERGILEYDLWPNGLAGEDGDRTGTLIAMDDKIEILDYEVSAGKNYTAVFGPEETVFEIPDSGTVTLKKTVTNLLDALCMTLTDPEELEAVLHSLVRAESLVSEGEIIGATSDESGQLIPWYRCNYADRLEHTVESKLEGKRICCLVAEITVPAGGSVELTASMTKVCRRDHDPQMAEWFDPGHGYDLATRLGSNLTFTGQTAALANFDGLEIVEQNFGFDPDSGIYEVELDPAVERYWVLVRGTDWVWEE